MANAESTQVQVAVDEGSDLSQLLRGYRFTVCQSRADVARAIEVRRKVYVDLSHYPIDVPDRYDRRSWFLLATETATGQAVGSLRITPRFAGPLELEEYFRLPGSLAAPRACELSRFAILPEHRKSTTFLPAVSLGLFNLVRRFLTAIDAEYMVICSKRERIWTYEWMRFQRTGLSARYAKLSNAEHELLWYDFRNAADVLEGHPFRDFFMKTDYREVIVPGEAPALGLLPSVTSVTPRWTDAPRLRMAASA
jgi:N-acyl-L-homoserine lactone synthetase